MQVQPRYSPDNCVPAYQLNWSLSIFGRTKLPSPANSLEHLRTELAKDELRILEFSHREPNVAQFFVSSRCAAAPSDIVRLVKGRWQYVTRQVERIDFRRNYRITSVGAAKADVLDAYVSRQPERHPMADCRAQELIESLQFHDRRVDLTSVRRSSHGQYRYALQIVIETASDWHEVRSPVLAGYRNSIIACCRKHQWNLSRVGMLSNHIHILVSPSIDSSPMQVALSLMNNMAFTQGMRPIFRYSFFAGTFGEYDRGAVWRGLGESS
jgi:REP element-mobilizing transposase RayT